MTPAELAVKHDGFLRAERRTINNLLYHAWHVAAFNRQKKLPELKSIMIDEDRPKPKKQTDDQMMAMARLLNAALGGKEV